ncbi:hypothetical protein [Flavobacterium tistrianum]|uniref:hypothetical protein n=1 Tax=Flavobacterium tistrianum TaxID=1685414 RepID=UPI000DAECE56|nr:hypothetical protein [Flavobacterium tistrianum]KAF2341031.1 hypothetical protein DMB71_11725 [Flavobacterium tistrianum]
MDTRNEKNDLFQEGIDRTQEANWDPILGYHMYFPNDENKAEELNEATSPIQKQNTGDWGDDADYEELRHKDNSEMNIQTFGNEDTKTD